MCITIQNTYIFIAYVCVLTITFTFYACQNFVVGLIIMYCKMDVRDNEHDLQNGCENPSVNLSGSQRPESLAKANIHAHVGVEVGVHILANDVLP